jgi:hypothetical protein
MAKPPNFLLKKDLIFMVRHISDEQKAHKKTFLVKFMRIDFKVMRNK